ncbi:MAG TPA: FAD-dependent oxidoreductase, partial [Thiotrichales bacterium]|nr:FAD-dependent oxidoreductase [Thiotrichales bacterium]
MSRPEPLDVLVIGSGTAGLRLALELAGTMRVGVLAKRELSEGSSYHAQGGIAAVLDPEDSVEAHVRDTLAAGAGLCHEDVVRFVAGEGPDAVRWLIDHGVHFTREEDAGSLRFHLTREGGHSHRRIIHAADATGREVETRLLELARSHAAIELFEWHIAIDLITSAKLGLPGPNRCLGAYVLDRNSSHVRVFPARFVVLATGGASKVYLYTSNPDTATGDGIAMAWRAGCRVANMEFNQFHPTCLYHPHAKSFLITEAVRGEGGRLLLPDGTPFMQ